MRSQAPRLSMLLCSSAFDEVRYDVWFKKLTKLRLPPIMLKLLFSLVFEWCLPLRHMIFCLVLGLGMQGVRQRGGSVIILILYLYVDAIPYTQNYNCSQI